MSAMKLEVSKNWHIERDGVMTPNSTWIISYDLYIAEDVDIRPGDRVYLEITLVSTDQ
jgi:hypothetical protein